MRMKFVWLQKRIYYIDNWVTSCGFYEYNCFMGEEENCPSAHFTKYTIPVKSIWYLSRQVGQMWVPILWTLCCVGQFHGTGSTLRCHLTDSHSKIYCYGKTTILTKCWLWLNRTNTRTVAIPIIVGNAIIAVTWNSTLR